MRFPFLLRQVFLRGLFSLLGRLGAVLGRSWGVLGRSWALLGRSWAVLGRTWVALGRSWVALGPSLAGVELSRVLLCRTHSLQSATGVLCRAHSLQSVMVCFVELIRRFPFSAAQVTESDFRRLEVVCGSLGIYYYEVVSPGSGNAGVGWFSSPGSASFSLFFGPSSAQDGS